MMSSIGGAIAFTFLSVTFIFFIVLAAGLVLKSIIE